jgi:hypothetical protein
MDFNQLMQKMRDLDQPVGEAAVQECGMDSPMMSNMPSMGTMSNMQPPPAHPSMSLNLNAQGLDNIESLMKLMTRVNPDMINQKAPLNAMPHAASIDSDDGMGMLTPPGPSISGIGDLGDLDKGPLKMLPDLDGDNDDMPGGEQDADSGPAIDIDMDGGDDVSKAGGDLDNDGDHDMDDHEMEKPEGDDEGDDESKEKEEGYENEPGEEYKSVDYMNNQLAGGMNKQKGTYPKVAGGDNPMQRNESGDLRAAIRAELLQRLAEAKGAK